MPLIEEEVILGNVIKIEQFLTVKGFFSKFYS